MQKIKPIKLTICFIDAPRILSENKINRFNELVTEYIGGIIAYLDICPSYSVRANGAYILLQQENKPTCKK